MEELLTPKLDEVNVVFPAENWFLYWRTSPSLWASRLKEYSGANPIFVPIYWALHSEYSDHYDFGQVKPETDLKKLSQVAYEVGREIIFFIQLTPMPFLINGGIPSYLARSVSIDSDGMAMSCFDHQNRLNRMYTFYEPRVFQAFRKFTYHLGQFFKESQINSKIYGLESYRTEDKHIISYFKDHSAVFENGFQRYLKQLTESEPEEIQKLKNHFGYEKVLKEKYFDLISGLYVEASKEAFQNKWSGPFKTCFLGGSTMDLFRRSQEKWESEKDYFEPLMKCVVNNFYPSTILLNHKVKKNSFGKSLKDLVSTAFVQAHLNQDYFDDDLSLSFQPLVFFEIVDSGEGFFNIENSLDDSGLKYFFEKNYSWSYKILKHFEADVDEMNPQKIYFYFGERLGLKQLNSLIKLFLSGFKIFIDTSKMDEAIISRLESFYVENSIEVEKLNYITPLHKANLGDGVILTYESAKLKQSSIIKRSSFWEKIFKYMEIKNLMVQADDDVEYFWKVRSSNTYELSYEEIRRVSLYNPTSYKRKARVSSSSNFALIKSLDEVNVEIKSTPIGIDIIMLPGGSVSLDFGYYEA